MEGGDGCVNPFCIRPEYLAMPEEAAEIVLINVLLILICVYCY